MYFGTRVSQTFVMQISRTWKQAALAAIAGASAGLVRRRAQRERAGRPAARRQLLGRRQSRPSMTIQFFNNSTDYNIFPLLLAGTQSKNDEWMEACFRILANQFPPAPIPRR